MKWEDSVKMFKDMGFNRVYPSDVRLSQVIEDLEADCKARRSGCGSSRIRGSTTTTSFVERKEVLATWPTGSRSRS